MMNAPDSSVRDLADRLSGADPERRASAAEDLAQLGPACRDACVELVQACGTDEVTREWAVAALEEMGPPAAEMVGPLQSLLNNECSDVVYWSSTLLGRLESSAVGAGDSLAAVIASPADLFVRERAIWAVRKIGCSSPVVIQALNAARDSEHERLSRLASEALAEAQS